MISGPLSYRVFRETGARDENQQQTQPMQLLFLEMLV